MVKTKVGYPDDVNRKARLEWVASTLLGQFVKAAKVFRKVTHGTD